MITQQKEKANEASLTDGQNRRSDIDWLRVGVVFMLFPYHTARVFETLEPFYIKNSETSEPCNWFIIIASPWSMPLLFFLAGAASWYALSFRTAGRYFQERLQRLLLPFLVALLLVVPPQAYFARLTRHTFSGNIIDFYPVYFQSYSLTKADYDGTIFTFAHLWFVFFLFIFSLMALPLFAFLKSEKGRGLISGLAGSMAGPVIFGLVPGLLLAASVAPDFLGKPALVYLVLFVVGFAFQGDERFRQVLNRSGYLTLALGLACSPVALLLFQYRQENGFPPGKLGFGLAYNLGSWFLLCAVLAFGSRYLNFSNPILKYVNRAAYPVYILHQTVIVMVAYFVVTWDLNVLLKYLVVLGFSIAISLGLYELVISRVGLFKVLFGMKAGKRTT
ncbi:MAG: acyltransferase [Chloroflexi bacterium]|nr:acyltransferase [Chloroflexota bacterium]OJW01853.1 MAG: hypothetical protein BGO39_28285 [Chloroflexi bacterium 54-19]